MKKLKYPNRIAVPVDKEQGKMLEQLARDTHRTRPGVFLEALRLFFERNYDYYRQKQRLDSVPVHIREKITGDRNDGE